MSFPWSRYFLHCFHHEVQEMYSHCNGRPCVLANVGNQVPDVCINLLLQSIQESVICLFIQGWQNDSARVDECGVCKQKWEANRCRRNSFQNRDWPHETTSHWVLSWVCLAEGMATWLVATTFSRAKEEFLQPLQAKSKSSSESTICMKIHIGRLFDCIWHANCNINELYIYCIYMYITDGCLHPYNTFSHYIHIPNDCNDFNIHHTSRNIQDIYMIYKYCVCHKGAWTVKGTVWTMSQQPPRQTSTSMPMILKDWCPEILG